MRNAKPVDPPKADTVAGPNSPFLILHFAFCIAPQIDAARMERAQENTKLSDN